MYFFARRVAACVLVCTLGVLALGSGASPVVAQIEPPVPPPAVFVDGDMEPAEAQAVMESYLADSAWDLDATLQELAVDGLLLEIALLVELDAFVGDPLPPRLAAIHAAYGPWAPADRAAIAAVAIEADHNLDAIYDLIDDQVEFASLDQALQPLPDRRLEQLGTPEATPFLPGVPYMNALSELLSRGTSAELVADGNFGIEMIAFFDETLDAAAFTADIDALETEIEALRVQIEALTPLAATENTGAAPIARWIPMLATAIVLALGAAATRLFRRVRRNDTTMTSSVTGELLDAHRLLAGVVDENDIVDIGTSAVMQIAGAHEAAIFRRVPEGLRRIGESTLIVHSALDPVIKNAAPLIDVIDNDPALGGPVAVCAVPIVVDGAVVGVLVATGNPDLPFDYQDCHHLEQLAPALGSALTSADALGNYENLAMVDGLTTLGNRRRLDGDLADSLAQAVAGNLPLAFAMIDVDHFKHYNDTHGHQAGDTALQAVARTIRDAVRVSDVVYRYGGEEFSVLLPGADRAEAMRVAERIRAAVEAAHFTGEEHQPDGRLTISVGVADLNAEQPLGLTARADDALYRAKAAGRNRSVFG